MECVIERSCGLDVHKKTVTACVLVPGANGAHEQHVRTFGMTVAELLALRDWLELSGAPHNSTTSGLMTYGEHAVMWSTDREHERSRRR